ncbi:RdgB/HAM1 family non-canonical purine NTP pyrophosphatase [Psychrobacter sp. HD31]|uniref:RdgB/HAM1 family non-canonical purine NTP pyrophosphatase n=1 Tax=Psychrobacter sp. HD31 TaxID=3112003 RepID=UPI003DA379E7
MTTKQTHHQQKMVIASNNQGKLAELQDLFNQHELGFQLIPQAQLDIEDAIEDGLSFVENAIIKARHASRISGLPAIADDSGLCVPALGNAPGIYSARYAGVEDKKTRDAANNAKLIEALAPIRAQQPDTKIIGQFVCVLVMVSHADDPLPIIAQGIWQGEILPTPLGENGFGYDPLFWVPTLEKASAQLSKDEKSEISHRGIASRELIAKIKQAL